MQKDVLLGLRSVEAALMSGQRRFERLLVDRALESRFQPLIRLAEVCFCHHVLKAFLTSERA